MNSSVVLVAQNPEPLYVSAESTSRSLVISNQKAVITGDIDISKVSATKRGRYATATDPNMLWVGILLDVDDVRWSGWVRLARLCPGQDYNVLLRKRVYRGLGLPRNIHEWPRIAGITACS